MSIKGKKVRAMRKKAGLTQGQLAKKAGVSERTIRQWESTEDIFECNLDNMLKIIEVMDCSLQDVVEDGQILRIRNKKQRL